MFAFDVRDLDRLPLAAKALGCAAAAACVLAVGYFLVLANLRAEWAGEQRRQDTLRAEQERHAALAPELAASRAERNRAVGAFAVLARRLSAQADATSVVADVGRAAAARGLVLANIALVPERETAEIIEQPIALALVGAYHDLGAFAADLAALPVPVTADDFQLEPAPDHAVDGTLTMTATWKTYRVANTGSLPVISESPDIDNAETAAVQPPSGLQAPPAGYGANRERDPFQPSPLGLPFERPAGAANAPREGRRRQPLERLPLEQLRLVGTLAAQGARRALVQTPDGNVHSVAAGDYLGIDQGRIRKVQEAGIHLVETVRDDNGGWLRRPRTLTMEAAPAAPDDLGKDQ